MADLGSSKVFGDLTVTGEITGEVVGNATSATKLETSRTISLSGDVTGSVGFDGTSNVTLTATVQDDSHNHVIGNIDGLQTELDGRLPTSGGEITGNLTVTGTTTTETLIETSSIRYKTNIVSLEDSLQKVCLLSGVSYDRKDGSNFDEVGLIAEDVYNIIPQVVNLDENGNPHSIQYTRLVSYLIESVKELKSEVDELKEKLNSP